MKTTLLLAALLVSAAAAQATPKMSTPKPKHLPISQVRTIFHQSHNHAVEGQKVATGPFLNHPETAPGPH